MKTLPPAEGFRRRELVLAALALLGGCGGVDSGGTGTGMAPPTLAYGPITGFGSIIVVGVRYDESNADIEADDGTMLARSALRLGMQAEVMASQIVSSATSAPSAVASSVRLRSEIVGPVEAIDTAAGELTVLGQRVAVVASTAFDDTLASIYTQTLSFTEQSCQFVDGCLGGVGERRLLRFDTITPNLGDADFYVGNHNNHPELFEQSECSMAWLFVNYARYRLLDESGAEVGHGHKSAFALIDLAPFTMDAGPPQYGFGEDMGISVGWADIYDAGLDCQWVDITDVPAGQYTLELSINPDHVIEESTYDNNILQLAVTIEDGGDLPGPPPEWVCPAEFFGTSDGCDCGCGALDPDCADATVESCDFCMAPGCANDCSEIDPTNNAVCL